MARHGAACAGLLAAATAGLPRLGGHPTAKQGAHAAEVPGARQPRWLGTRVARVSACSRRPSCQQLLPDHKCTAASPRQVSSAPHQRHSETIGRTTLCIFMDRAAWISQPGANVSTFGSARCERISSLNQALPAYAALTAGKLGSQPFNKPASARRNTHMCLILGCPTCKNGGCGGMSACRGHTPAWGPPAAASPWRPRRGWRQAAPA
jgi:hypothetical protein